MLRGTGSVCPSVSTPHPYSLGLRMLNSSPKPGPRGIRGTKRSLAWFVLTLRFVTVAAGKCTDAGMLASFAMLRGRGAERYLAEHDVRYWCLR